MQLANRYYKCSKLSEVKFRYLLRLFALDLTASDAARLTGLSTRTVNALYLHLRHRFLAWNPVPAELAGAVELDESYFGPRRVRGKRGRGRAAKPLSLVCSNAAGKSTRKSSPTALKRPCKPFYVVKLMSRPWSIPTAGAATTGWWTWASTAISASATASTHSCRGPRTSTASSPFWSFAKARLQQFKGVPKHTFLLHLKESEFRFNHRYEDLYKRRLKLLRQQPPLT
jgi:transposase